MLIFDAHLDLAMNAIEWNRDLTQPLGEIRKSEARLSQKGRGCGTVSLPEMRRAGVGICVATQIARVEHNAWSPVAGWRSAEQAWAMTQAQLAWYQAMEEAGEMKQIRTRGDLEKCVSMWSGEKIGNRKSKIRKRDDANENTETKNPIGYILSLEGADSILSMRHLEKSVEAGLRAIGPAHYGPGIYANGTDATGKLNARGRELLREMERLGLILDATHLCDDAFWEALDIFTGKIWASHHNCRALAPHNRQLSDEMIRALVQRGAVIGVAFDAWMLVPAWVRGKTQPREAGVTLATVVEHIDHVCQIAGSARHSGIGSDLDGAFGTEQTPADLDSIADIARVADLLRARGFSQSDVEAVMSKNFIRFLREALP